MLALLTRICKHAGPLVGILHSSMNSLLCYSLQGNPGPQVGQRTRSQNPLACIYVSVYFKLHRVDKCQVCILITISNHSVGLSAKNSRNFFHNEEKRLATYELIENKEEAGMHWFASSRNSKSSGNCFRGALRLKPEYIHLVTISTLKVTAFEMSQGAVILLMAYLRVVDELFPVFRPKASCVNDISPEIWSILLENRLIFSRTARKLSILA